MYMQVIVEPENQVGSGITYYLYDDSFVTVEAVAKIKMHSEYVELLYINVNRNYRGNGKGSYLLNRILSDFDDRKVIVETFKERVAWYEKFGFIVTYNHANIYMLERKAIHSKLSVNQIITS